tara:strand:- start:9 stop:155 length:147 start_codon:yes stop_codon:yes gene_type:complete
MTDEFYEWLNQCPVQWVRLGTKGSLHLESATYEFYADTEDTEDEQGDL